MEHLRFRLRTIFGLVTLCALVYALSVTEAQRQRTAVRKIEKLGGFVLYEAAAYNSEPLCLLPWLTSVLGPDWFHSVDAVHLPGATDESLALLEALPETKKLNLCTPMFTTRGIRYVTALPKLESLRLDGGTVTDSCMLSLGQLKHLKHLEVRSGAITDESMPVIGRLPAIRSVNLADCSVTHQGLKALGDSSVVSLQLSGIKINAASASAIATMRSLEEVNLSEATVSRQALQRLTSHVRWRRLTDEPVLAKCSGPAQSSCDSAITFSKCVDQQIAPDQVPADVQLKMSRTTLPSTSVKRNSRPW